MWYRRIIMYRLCWCLFAILSLCTAVLLQDGEEEPYFSDEHESFNSVFQTCLRTEVTPGIGTVMPCFSKGALAGLSNANDENTFEVADGVTLFRDLADHSSRTLLPIDRDPTDYRSVLDATNAFFSHRALRWDLGGFYPGLVLKVGPSLGADGVMEFELDRRYHLLNDRSLGTGRLILKQIFLPLLLGLKVKLVTLIPLFFGALILISKKALIVSKVALLISGFLGLNSLFLLNQKPNSGISSLQQDSSGFLGVQNSPPLLDPLGLYGGQGFRGVSYHTTEEQFKKADSRGARNFAWEPEGVNHPRD